MSNGSTMKTRPQKSAFLAVTKRGSFRSPRTFIHSTSSTRFSRFSLTGDLGLALQQQLLIVAAALLGAAERFAINCGLRVGVRGQSRGVFGQLGDGRHQGAARPLQDPVLSAHLVKIKTMSSPHTSKETDILSRRVLLWRPAPPRSPCRSARSETGSPAYRSLSRADWRLEQKVEAFSQPSLYKRRPWEKSDLSGLCCTLCCI